LNIFFGHRTFVNLSYEVDIAKKPLIDWLTSNNANTSRELYGKLNGILSDEENENVYEQKYREIFPSYEYNGNIIKPSYEY
jgi:hypothetical protein